MNDIYLNSFQQILKEDTVLYVEDHDTLQNSIHNFLQQSFNKVLSTNCTKEAMKFFVNNKIDILIVDIYNKQAVDRIEMLNNIKCFSPYLPILAVVKDSIVGHTLKELEFGIGHIILKPLELRVLIKEVNKVYHNININASIRQTITKRIES